jgi:hypothetical protein
MRRCQAFLPLNVLFFKLQRTSLWLKQWSKRLFVSARAELHMANEIILQLGMAQDTRPLSPEELQLRGP